MKYSIKIAEQIEKKFKRIPIKDKSRIFERIESLAKDPRPKDCKKLQGQQRPPLYRIRAGNYRIIYKIEEGLLIVLIVDLGHRKDIYKA